MVKITNKFIKNLAKELGFKEIVFEINTNYLNINSAGCAGFDYINFGITKDKSIMLINLFHEYGHCICNLEYKKDYMTQYELEYKCWKLAFKEYKKYNFKLTNKQLLHAIEQLSTYANYEIKEFTSDSLLRFQEELNKFNRNKVVDKV